MSVEYTATFFHANGKGELAQLSSQKTEFGQFLQRNQNALPFIIDTRIVTPKELCASRFRIEDCDSVVSDGHLVRAPSLDDEYALEEHYNIFQVSEEATYIALLVTYVVGEKKEKVLSLLTTQSREKIQEQLPSGSSFVIEIDSFFSDTTVNDQAA